MSKRPSLSFSTATRAAAKPETGEAGEDRVFISGRIPPVLYRQVKGFAGEQGRKVQDVLEAALTEYLANHRR
jgi:hypothetical protein